MKRQFLLGIGFVLAAAVFIWGANSQSSLVNTNMQEMDQSAYLDYARNLAETNYTFVGDRNRMPLYPALMSLSYKPGIPDDVFFDRGKKLGIVIALLGLLFTYLIFYKVSNKLHALTGTLVAAFTVFVYKAPYFQAEVLFYPIGLLLFYLLISFISKPNVKTAALAGIVGGIGHLTKASVLPAVLLAALVVFVHGVILQWRQNRDADITDTEPQDSFTLWKVISTIIILLFCFLVIVFPYIQTSKVHFGKYFYNVNSTFYIWYDSWEEAELGTKAYGDRQGWPDMPAEDIPSLKKYLSEHTLGDVANRLLCGFCGIQERTFQSYGYVEFMIVYGIALILISYQNKDMWLNLFSQQEFPYVLIFVMGYFLGYLLLYAWYHPIAGGNRFVLSLFLPALLLITRMLSYAQEYQLHFSILDIKVSASSVSVFVLIFLISYLIVVFPNRISTMFGGY